MNTSTSIKQRTLKLALVAFACGAAVISGPSSAASPSASAVATGTVISPITVTSSAPLSFGRFAPGVGGSVTISNSGVRTSSGIIPSAMGAATTAAKFLVTGDPAATYSISQVVSPELTNTTGTGNETMSLATTSDLAGANVIAGNVSAGTLSGAGTQTIFVGGTLTVGSTQVPGDYAGTVAVTVEYN